MRTPARIHREELVWALEELAQYGIPGAGAAHLFDVGTDDFLSFLEAELLDDIVVGGGATVKLVEGAYGSGKTHLLQLIHGLALRRGMVVVRTDLSQAVGLEDWKLITQHVLQHMEVRLNGVSARSLPSVLELLGRNGFNFGESFGQRPHPHPGFGRAMRLMLSATGLNNGGRELLHRYLQGDKVSVVELKHYGVEGVKQPLSARNAEHALKTVLQGLHRIGVPGTMLLFDETENTFIVNRADPPRRVKQAANLMRHLIDGCTTGSFVATLTVFAVLPGFVENCGVAYAALGQRLHIHRDRRFPAGWRSPVLQVDGLSTARDPRDFLAAIADKMRELLTRSGVPANGLAEQLRDAGEQVLNQQAGSGYRRALLKRLGTLALQHL